MQPFVQEIEQQVRDYQEQGLRLCVSSSFQTHSIPMLHILSKIESSIPVYFLNTGFHFPETIIYKKQISDLLGLNTQDLTSPISMLNQKDQDGYLMYTSNPDYCCHLNKILPMEPILAKYNVWISGVRAEQSSHRQTLATEERIDENTRRYHPMLFWTSKMIYEYRIQHHLPEHPLDSQGYVSIGCKPCTVKYIGDERTGRWKGMKKEECGLHTELLEKK